MKKVLLILAAVMMIASPCAADDFTDFGMSFSWSSNVVFVPDLYYLLVAGTTDNLATPTGDRITSPQ